MGRGFFVGCPWRRPSYAGNEYKFCQDRPENRGVPHNGAAGARGGVLTRRLGFEHCPPPSGGAVAQLGERLVRNEEVRGSIPLSSTTRLAPRCCEYCHFRRRLGKGPQTCPPRVTDHRSISRGSTKLGSRDIRVRLHRHWVAARRLIGVSRCKPRLEGRRSFRGVARSRESGGRDLAARTNLDGPDHDRSP